MYALVAHHYWGTPGGGQLVCAATAASLEALGYKPVLTGTFKFDPAKYREWYGIDISKYPAVTFPIGAKAFGLWARLWVWRPAAKAIKKYKPSLVFIDEVTYKPLLKAKDFKLVEYIHFPFEVVVDPRFKGTGLAYGEDPYIMERYGKFPLNLYWKVFVAGLRRYMRDNPFHAADAVLVNSKWTAEVAEMVYGERPEILNPPLPPNVEIVERPRPFEERRPVAVMLGRFSQEKRYHWVVTEVAPKLFKEVPEAKLVIFGGAATPTLQAYKERVKALAQKAGLKVAESLEAEAQVYLIANAPRRLINQVMDGARAFFHATINEHWGIAVAEAMARGLPPVVHKSGGTWTDLAEEGRYGLGYETAEEAVAHLAKALTQPLGLNAQEKVKALDMGNYKMRLSAYV
ncbi:MAG: glycosyltransferase [Pyrobaculum sp.]